MEELDQIFREATGSVDEPYFRLPIDGGDPVYRERVYCYELYHQMRSRWPENCPFWLNGEIDKGGHPLLRAKGADYAKPDFLIHTPGDMDGNHAIIEVKSEKAAPSEIWQDLRKLSQFVTDIGYARAIYLIYGYRSDHKADQIARMMQSSEQLAPIELWVHAGPGDEAVQKI